MPDDLRRLTSIVTLECSLTAVTGLRIGAAESSISIGGMDNPVVRDPITNQPYIPGSSIKGKMRSLLERRLEKEQNWPISDIRIHACKEQSEYNACDICQLFGIPAPRQSWFCLTRLRVSDTFLSQESVEKLEQASTDLPYTEVKTEAAIDRVTSAATPRQMERVPAGAVFQPVRLSLFRYKDDPPELVDRLIEGMELLEADYLGGAGSRGSGRVAFGDITVKEFALPASGPNVTRTFDRVCNSVADIRNAANDLRAWLTEG